MVSTLHNFIHLLTIHFFASSWTFLGSQGRYRLATYVAAVSSWFVTLPLAALFTFQLDINLQGQTAAVVIGYMVGGSLNTYYLFRSDWEGLSETVQQANENELQDDEPTEPDIDEAAETSVASPPILPFTTTNFGALGTLAEGKPGEESFVSDADSSFVVTPDSTPEKELV